MQCLLLNMLSAHLLNSVPLTETPWSTTYGLLLAKALAKQLAKMTICRTEYDSIVDAYTRCDGIRTDWD